MRLPRIPPPTWPMYRLTEEHDERGSMSNYIDLEPQVSDYYGTMPGQSRRAGICDALRYLDSHPNQVPGRTITASRKREIAQRLEFDPRYSFDEMVHDFGLVSVPDPEPTNAEKLEARLLDLLGVVEAIGNTGVHNMAYELDRAGVTALGGRDE